MNGLGEGEWLIRRRVQRHRNLGTVGVSTWDEIITETHRGRVTIDSSGVLLLYGKRKGPEAPSPANLNRGDLPAQSREFPSVVKAYGVGAWLSVEPRETKEKETE